MSLEKIKAAVAAVDPQMDPEDDAYKASVILLASISDGIGPSADKIAELTGHPRSYVRTIASRLRKSGIWQGGKVHCNWFDAEEGWVAFMCDVNVALGMLNRVAA